MSYLSSFFVRTLKKCRNFFIAIPRDLISKTSFLGNQISYFEIAKLSFGYNINFATFLPKKLKNFVLKN
jgi:hypothetical protein